MTIPQPVRIFHITAIANLAQLCAAGELRSKALLAQNGQGYSNIAYQGAQSTRAVRAVTAGPGGVVHDYVPFYFAPRSPMLYTINRGNVAGCTWRQNDIVHIESTVDQVVAQQLPFVFFDRNATLVYSKAYDSLTDLGQVAWGLITEHPCLDGYCQYWHSKSGDPTYGDRMERRQAEFLVHQRFPLALSTRIGVANAAAKVTVDAILARAGIGVPVVVKPEWYF